MHDQGRQTFRDRDVPVAEAGPEQRPWPGPMTFMCIFESRPMDGFVNLELSMTG